MSDFTGQRRLSLPLAYAIGESAWLSNPGGDSIRVQVTSLLVEPGQVRYFVRFPDGSERTVYAFELQPEPTYS